MAFDYSKLKGKKLVTVAEAKGIGTFDPDTDKKMLMTCSHHDQPMGGERVVTFYSPREFVYLAKQHGMTIKDMGTWLFENHLSSDPILTEDEIIECIAVMKHEDLQDFIDS